MSSPTTVCEFFDGKYKSYIISPEDFGFQKCEKSELLGGTPKENAAIILALLSGEKSAKRNAVLMNSGAALYIAGKAKSISEGITIASNLIDTGAAYAKLKEFIEKSN
jgi:anthranilate phosphoribosyltransferase